MLYRIISLKFVILMLLACQPGQRPPEQYHLKGPFDSNIIRVQYFRFSYKEKFPELHAVFSESWNRNFGQPHVNLVREPVRQAFREMTLFIGEGIKDVTFKPFIAELMRRGFDDLPATNEARITVDWLRRAQNDENICRNARIITIQTDKIRKSVMALDVLNNEQLGRKFQDVEALTIAFVNGNSVSVGIQIEPFRID